MKKPSLVRLDPDQVGDYEVDLVEHLWKKNGPPYPLCRASVLNTLQRTADEGVLVRRGTGLAGAIFTNLPWRNDIRVAYIVFWGFKNARDIGVFEDICKICLTAGGAHAVNVASHCPENRIGRYYTKLGFEAMETQWMYAPHPF